MTGTELPGRQVMVTLGFTNPISPKTNRAAAPASPCNDSTAAKFNIPWRMVRTRRQR